MKYPRNKGVLTGLLVIIFALSIAAGEPSMAHAVNLQPVSIEQSYWLGQLGFGDRLDKIREEISALQETIISSKKEVLDKQEALDYRQRIIDDKSAEIADKSNEIRNLYETIRDLEVKVAEKRVASEDLDAFARALDNRDAKITERENQLDIRKQGFEKERDAFYASIKEIEANKGALEEIVLRKGQLEEEASELRRMLEKARSGFDDERIKYQQRYNAERKDYLEAASREKAELLEETKSLNQAIVSLSQELGVLRERRERDVNSWQKYTIASVAIAFSALVALIFVSAYSFMRIGKLEGRQEIRVVNTGSPGDGPPPTLGPSN